tara:strand:+ start:130 stop:1680 length:1551 start_codon:yes stop_codon:yes gene_type:complete
MPHRKGHSVGAGIGQGESSWTERAAQAFADAKRNMAKSIQNKLLATDTGAGLLVLSNIDRNLKGKQTVLETAQQIAAIGREHLRLTEVSKPTKRRRGRGRGRGSKKPSASDVLEQFAKDQSAKDAERAAEEKRRKENEAARLARIENNLNERQKMNDAIEDRLIRGRDAERKLAAEEGAARHERRKETRQARNRLRNAQLKGTYIPPSKAYSTEHPRMKHIFGEDDGICPTPDFVNIMHVPTGRLASFMAFVNTVSDTYALNWNPEEVYGRMDPIMTYSSTKRNMSLDFVVVADRYSEGVRNMQSINQLVQNLYPSYKTKRVLGQRNVSLSTSRINAAPLLRISWANMLSSPNSSKGMLVATDSVSINPNLDAGFFESSVVATRGHAGGATTDNRVYDGKIIPKEITISLSFTVLHDFTLGWNSDLAGPDTKHPFALDPKGGFYKFPYNFATTDEITGEPTWGPEENVKSYGGQIELEKNFDEEVAIARTWQLLNDFGGAATALDAELEEAFGGGF